MKCKKHSGLTLVELCISLTLISLVMVAGMQLLGVTFKGVHDIDEEIRVEREDSTFAALVNENIQKSSVLFTIPKESFINDKLTPGWNYIGVMDNVKIPEACSRTGKEINSAKALVYIEYLGSDKPASHGYDCNIIQGHQGYFSQKILGHAFTDSNGNFHDYSLVFEPEDPTKDTSQNIKYDFVSTVTDKDGNKVGEGKGIDIDTMLHSLNSLSINYRGNDLEGNPAVAIAFKPNFMPIQGLYDTSEHNTNIVLIVDSSETLPWHWDEGINRLEKLKEGVLNMLSEFSSELKDIHVILIPVGDYGAYPPIYGLDDDEDSAEDIQLIYDLNTDYDELVNTINNFESQGYNNSGDAFKLAYYTLKEARDEGKLDLEGNNYVIFACGTLISSLSVTKDWGKYDSDNPWASRNPLFEDAYFGDNWIPPKLGYPHSHSFCDDEQAVRYVVYWKDQLVREFHMDKTYYISFLSEFDKNNGIGMNENQDWNILKEEFDVKYKVEDIKNLRDYFKFVGDDIIEILNSISGPLL